MNFSSQILFWTQ